MSDSIAVYCAIPAALFSIGVIVTYCCKNLPRAFGPGRRENPPAWPEFTVPIVFAGLVGTAMGFTVSNHWSGLGTSDAGIAFLPIFTGAVLATLVDGHRYSRVPAASAFVIGLLVALPA